ncbi:MAG: peptidylprolyl isomerase [Sutterellaceae bacterium]|nr:peptidylprolyl isomerase [Burkholderiaceae bacterium]MCX7901480.1 peptidylprolyl isomerase [Burkholderiaceae bacterium]MDW8430787.1 peptidylprolyl isomerase [Sutterellaceae bacterium]
MKIAAGCLVTLDVKMYDAQGNLLEASESPLVYLHGASDIFPAVEQALDGKEPGFTTSLYLQPHQAFGEDDPTLLHIVDRRLLGPAVTVGMRVEGVPGQPNDGRIYTVTELTDDVAVLDGNHPLAGRALRFDVTVRAVEALTPEELEQAQAPLVPDFLRPAAAHDLHDAHPRQH